MTNYDFLNISPFEFEILSRDLLQAELDIRLEAFGAGTDKGIDLRFAQGENLIVQCKRYKTYNSLYQELKKEVIKVSKLNPEKYILTTSVSLSPHQKTKIQELFTPFILFQDDIYTRDDLNNLINLHPKIERDHYKLWLSSTNILHTILNSQVVNQSKFVFEEIKEKIHLYVQNNSFFEALDILKENKYVIISGIPGIGKTTLAQILVFDLLARGAEEFIFLSDSINQGFQLFNEEKSQVFLFDDFLGRNFLENSLKTNEEGQILRFISKIQKSENKVLIFTTREYILNQAQLKFDHFDNLDFKKCIMDLSKYTTIIKAKILYNHLFFNNIPFEYIEELISQKYLMQIINHQNYNPRIIESFTQSKLWDSCNLQEFPSKLKKVFDYPDTIWLHAYENQISELSRYVLCCLALFNGHIDSNNLFEQFKAFTKQHNPNNNINNLSFKKALRELDNSFIKINRDYQKTVLISFQNPSIQDFLLKYLDEDIALKKDLITSSIYIKPILDIFSNRDTTTHDKHRFSLDINLEKYYTESIINSFDSLSYSPDNRSYSKPSLHDVEVLKLSSIVFNVIYSEESNFKRFVLDRLNKIVYSGEITNYSVNDFYSLIDKFHSDLNVDILKVISNILESIWDYDDLWIIKDFEDNYPDEYEKFIDEFDETYNDILASIVSDIARRDSENIQDDINTLEELENEYYIDTSIERRELEIKSYAREEEAQMYMDEEYLSNAYEFRTHAKNDSNDFDNMFIKKEDRPLTEEDKIENMFNSLK